MQYSGHQPLSAFVAFALRASSTRILGTAPCETIPGTTGAERRYKQLLTYVTDLGYYLLRRPSRESSFFASICRSFSAVCIRTNTERSEARGKGYFTLAGIDERGLLNAVRTAETVDAEGLLPAAPVPYYSDENVSTKVVKNVQSYTSIDDRMV